VTSSANWLTSSPTSGSSYTQVCLGVETNPTGRTRTATVTFAADSATVTFTVTQAATPTVTLDPLQRAFPAAGGSATVKVTTLGPAWVAYVPTNTWWLSLDRGGGPASEGFTVTAAANQSATARIGYITLNCAGESLDYAVTQEGEALTFSPALTAATFPALGGTVTATVQSNAGPWRLTDYPTWAKPATTSGNDTDRVVLTAEANPMASPREGQVVLRAGLTAKLTLTVQQPGASATTVDLALTLAPAEATVAASGGLAATAVTAAEAWQVTALPDWITAESGEGPAGTTTVAFTVAANRTTGTRRGTVVLSAPHSPSVEFTVTQSGDSIWSIVNAVIQRLVQTIHSLLSIFRPR
jgi:hypothetical protein